MGKHRKNGSENGQMLRHWTEGEEYKKNKNTKVVWYKLKRYRWCISNIT